MYIDIPGNGEHSVNGRITIPVRVDFRTSVAKQCPILELTGKFGPIIKAYMLFTDMNEVKQFAERLLKIATE